MAFVTDAGLQRILAVLSEDLTYIGISAQAPTETDTDLPGEYARKAVSLTFIDGQTAVFETFFDETEGNGTINGWGVFGEGATSTVGSGTLIMGGPADFIKTNEDSLTLSAEITVRRAAN